MAPRHFTRHRYELPMLFVFIGLGTVELAAMHLLVGLWIDAAAWVLTGLTLLGLLHLLALVRGLVRWPTLLEADRIIVRHGRAKGLSVPLAAVRAVENVAFAPEERGSGVLRATLLASPNLAIRLSQPVEGPKGPLCTILLRLDEPALFQVAVAERLATSGWPRGTAADSGSSGSPAAPSGW